MNVWIALIFCLTQLVVPFVYGQTDQTQDLFERRALIEQRIRSEAYAKRKAQEQQALFTGFRKIAGHAAIDYATSTCSAAWNALQRGQPVAKLCDTYGCLPVYGLASEGFEGYLSSCRINLTNGWQCRASSSYDNGVPLYSASCLDPNLNQHDFLINQSTGAVRKDGGRPRPRR